MVTGFTALRISPRSHGVRRRRGGGTSVVETVRDRGEGEALSAELFPYSPELLFHFETLENGRVASGGQGEFTVEVEMELHAAELSLQDDVEPFLLELEGSGSCFASGDLIPDIPEDRRHHLYLDVEVYLHEERVTTMLLLGVWG